MNNDEAWVTCGGSITIIKAMITYFKKPLSAQLSST